MSQIEKAKRFAKLHVKGRPILLFNALDAGSAKSIVDAGAKAIATSSWSVAVAQGYEDGEQIPTDFLLTIAKRITNTVNVPVTIDFEGGYSEDDGVLANNISRLLDTGIIGINFEDRVVQGSGLYSAERQAKRIAAIRKAAQKKGIDLFINARTDVFLLAGKKNLTKVVDDALAREKLYTDAGASGFFIP
jgi:2-methylisocitrate lyase-like PEP mutase family enzyme